MTSRPIEEPPELDREDEAILRQIWDEIAADEPPPPPRDRGDDRGRGFGPGRSREGPRPPYTPRRR